MFEGSVMVCVVAWVHYMDHSILKTAGGIANIMCHHVDSARVVGRVVVVGVAPNVSGVGVVWHFVYKYL